MANKALAANDQNPVVVAFIIANLNPHSQFRTILNQTNITVDGISVMNGAIYRNLSERSRQSLWFWLFWLLLSWSLGIYGRLDLPPQGIHQGAQCDRASLAWNFAYTDANILKPHVHETRFGDGTVAGEFPLVPWMASACYRVFGFHHLWFRGINWLILSMGVWCAFLITGFFINHLFHRLLLIALWTLSPILLFYGPSFLPDTAALACTMAAWYFLMRWRFQMRGMQLSAGILFLGLAGLLKITFSAGFIPAAWLIFQHLRTHDAGNRKWMLPGVLMLVASLSILVWYRHATALNAAYGNVHFLLQAKPAASLHEARELSVSIVRNWIEQFYRGPYIFALFALGVISAFFPKKQDVWQYHTGLWYLLAAIGYFILMQSQFLYHDYYFIFFYVPVFFVLLQVYQRSIRFSGGMGCALFLLYLLPLLHYDHTAKALSERYRPGSYWEQTITDLNTWQGADRWLDSLGVPRNEKALLTGYDPAPNNQLYFLQRRGKRFHSDYSPETVQGIIIQHNIRWLVLTDAREWDAKYRNDSVFTTETIGSRAYLQLRRVNIKQ